jgi:hypothetical protein
MVPAAGENTALSLLSIVGWFSLLPSLGYVAGSVVPDVCRFALAAVRAPLEVMRGEAQSDSRLATILGG